MSKTKSVCKNMHYSLNFLNFKPYYNGHDNVNYIMTYNVKFTDESKYDVGEDQSDINKLFGVSYGHHHNQSDRIGWRYNKKTDLIDLFLYSYENSKRIKTYLTSVTVGYYDTYIINLDVMENNGYRNTNVSIYKTLYGMTAKIFSLSYMYKHTHTKYGYSLGLYFGGNQKAPKTIKMDIEKIESEKYIIAG
jgi:hypothetical protein